MSERTAVILTWSGNGAGDDLHAAVGRLSECARVTKSEGAGWVSHARTWDRVTRRSRAETRRRRAPVHLRFRSVILATTFETIIVPDVVLVLFVELVVRNHLERLSPKHEGFFD